VFGMQNTQTLNKLAVEIKITQIPNKCDENWLSTR
jgi:hypothetical protein